jgi:hypothetical protein
LSEPFICLSSGASPRYREDITRALALPVGTVLQFRYDKAYLTQAVRIAVEQGTAAGQPAIIVYIDQSVQGQAPSYVPCRYARIRTESAAALMYYFGVGANAAWAWRKAFGVAGRARTSPGTKRAVRAAAKLGAEAVKAREWTPAERKARSRLARRQGRPFPPRWTPGRGGWTGEQLALLGTDHDEAVAKRIGRTLSAVTSRRVALKVPAFSAWPGGGRGWTDEELALLGTMSDTELAGRLDRTPGAVAQKRQALGVPAHSGWRGGGRAWTAEEEALLGTDRDSAVAARLGRSPNAVALRRKALGVPAFGGRAGGGKG